jgi:hypothetical protein
MTELPEIPDVYVDDTSYADDQDEDMTKGVPVADPSAIPQDEVDIGDTPNE